MDFILKDGYIYLVKNEVSPNNKVEGNVVIKYVDDYQNKSFSYSINDKPYKRIVNEKIVIEKQELDRPYLDLKIKATNNEVTQIFKTDRLPITYSLVIGGKLEDSYTQTLNTMFKRLESQDLKIQKLQERIKDLEEVGELI